MADPLFPPLHEQSCFGCRYWRRGKDDSVTIDLCCRYAPRPSTTVEYPARIPHAQWCGEWSGVEMYR
jgi:hypothetical protein